MANEPTIIGNAGWRTVFDYSAGSGDSSRIRVRQGPYITIDGEIAALRATLNVQSLDPSVSIGSAVASIRCTYRQIPDGGLPLSERRSPVYAITPIQKTMDLRGHPYVNPLGKDIPKIEKFIAAGEIEAMQLAYAGNARAIGFAQYWVAGVTSYEEASFQLVITRYYTSTPTISADYTAINTVFAWSAIRTDGKTIPSYVEEPKYVSETGAVSGFEWRLVSVAPVIERNAENVVTWTYIGCYAWAKSLYKGGTWEPSSL